MSDPTRENLYKLYRYAMPQSKQEIGLVFDAAFYHEAMKLFDKKCERQFKQKWDKHTFWNICVEEWLAACLGTRFLRQHAQGVNYRWRRRGCVLADGSSYFAFRRFADFTPGHRHLVGIDEKPDHSSRPYICGWILCFGTYVKQQRVQRQTLCDNLQRAAKHRSSNK